MKLADKVAIVTGGASGIGKAIVKRFFDEGARVVVADRDTAAAEALAKSLGAGSFSVVLDVTNQESIDRLVAVVAERAGGIDVLVNCAAIYALTPITEVSREQWSTLFSINVDGTFFTIQAVAKQMIKQGRGGKIINLAQPSRPARGAIGRGLLCNQGCRDQSYSIGGPGFDPTPDQCERHCTRNYRYADVGCGRPRVCSTREPAYWRKETPDEWGDSDRTNGTAGRSGGLRCLSCFRGLGLRGCANLWSGWWELDGLG